MKKVFIYIGTRSDRRSKTFEYLSKVLRRTIDITGKENVKIDMHITSSSDIKGCRGCLNCFFKGNCPQDNSDDMKMLKEKMLDADFIIFASPVYLHNVSGDMKIFIDRISYWSHLFRLRGKAGIAIATSTGNGLDHVTNYLSKVMTYLGINVVGTFGVTPYIEDERLEQQVEKCSDILVEYINGKKVESNEALEMIFEANRQAMEKQANTNSAEYEYWKENKLLECKSFKEAIELERK